MAETATETETASSASDAGPAVAETAGDGLQGFIGDSEVKQPEDGLGIEPAGDALAPGAEPQAPGKEIKEAESAELQITPEQDRRAMELGVTDQDPAVRRRVVEAFDRQIFSGQGMAPAAAATPQPPQVPQLPQVPQPPTAEDESFHYALNLDTESVDEALAGQLKGFNDHVGKHLTGMAHTIVNLAQRLNRTESVLSQSRVSEFDRLINSPDFEAYQSPELLGKGTVHDLHPQSPACMNRARAYALWHEELPARYAAMRVSVPSPTELLRATLAGMFPDRQAKAVRREIEGEIAKGAGRVSAGPDQRGGKDVMSPAVKTEDESAWARDYCKEHGIPWGGAANMDQIPAELG